MQYVGQLVLSRNWGSSQLAKLRDSGSTLRRRRRFLYLGTNLILPDRGAPSGSATPFSRIGAFPEKIFILHLRVIWQGSKFPVTKTEQTITGPCPLGATGGVRLDPFGRNCTATTRVFLFQNPEIQVEARVHCTL